MPSFAIVLCASLVSCQWHHHSPFPRAKGRLRKEDITTRAPGTPERSGSRRSTRTEIQILPRLSLCPMPSRDEKTRLRPRRCPETRHGKRKARQNKAQRLSLGRWAGRGLFRLCSLSPSLIVSPAEPRERIKQSSPGWPRPGRLMHLASSAFHNGGRGTCLIPCLTRSAEPRREQAIRPTFREKKKKKKKRRKKKGQVIQLSDLTSLPKRPLFRPQPRVNLPKSPNLKNKQEINK